MSNRIYIDLNPLLNSPAWFKQAITTKGDGKTTALIKTAIKSRQNTGLTPVFCRRYGTELGDQFKRDVLNKIKQHMPDVWKAGDFVWQGNLKKGGLYLINKKEPDALPYMHAFPLSMIEKMKSGLDVTTHRNIYIDEYIPLSGRYLPHEVTDILDLYQTVDRDSILKVKPYLNYVICCGNKIGHIPATDLYFNVDHNYNTNALTLYKNGTFAILSYANKGHIQNVKQSPFESLIAGTDYAEYAHGGQLRPITPQLWKRPFPATSLIIKGKESIALCGLTFNDGIVLKLIPAPDLLPLSVMRLTIEPTDNSGYVWIKRVGKLCQYMRAAFARGQVYYTDKHSAAAVQDIVTYLSRL